MKKVKLESSKIVYFILVGIAGLELIVALLGIIFAQDSTIRDAGFSNLFLALLAIALFSLPWIIETRFKIDIPNYLEIIVICFVFFAIVLGNIHNFLVTVQGYDKVLHIVSGITISIIAYEIIHMYNQYRPETTRMTPGMLSIFAFTFSIALLVLWEFYEFGVDTIAYNIDATTDRNMQRYQWVNTSDVFPQPYGLMDTMLDLIVGAVGATVVSLTGWILTKRNIKKGLTKEVKS